MGWSFSKRCKATQLIEVYYIDYKFISLICKTIFQYLAGCMFLVSGNNMLLHQSLPLSLLSCKVPFYLLYYYTVTWVSPLLIHLLFYSLFFFVLKNKFFLLHMPSPDIPTCLKIASNSKSFFLHQPEMYLYLSKFLIHFIFFSNFIVLFLISTPFIFIVHENIIITLYEMLNIKFIWSSYTLDLF